MQNRFYNREFFETIRDGSVRSADVIVPLVMGLLPVTSVVDVGCGQGAWLASFQRRGVSDILGMDGDYVDRSSLFIPAEKFAAADLTKPMNLGRRFDLAVSMEVAEHLPAEGAGVFVETLTRLAPAVLFSAAVPFQGGNHHINEQWQSYWAELFAACGYRTIDCIRSKVWDDPAVEWWYAQNTLLFVYAEFAAMHPVLADGIDRTDLARLNLVHPKNFLCKEDLRREAIAELAAVPPLSKAWPDLFRSIKRSIEWRLAGRKGMPQDVGDPRQVQIGDSRVKP